MSMELPQTGRLTRTTLRILCHISAYKDWEHLKQHLPGELARKLQQIARYGVGGAVELQETEILDLALALDLTPSQCAELHEHAGGDPILQFLAQDIPKQELVLARLLLAAVAPLEGTETRLRGLRGVLKKIRRKRGLTQAEVARRAHFPQEKISEIENGRLRGRTARERARELHQYLRAIGCTQEEYQQILEACMRGFTVGVD